VYTAQWVWVWLSTGPTVTHEFACRLHVAGLRGLQGIVHKTISDDLQCNIWKPTHVNKIMPSLLVNLQQDDGFVDVLHFVYSRNQLVTVWFVSYGFNRSSRVQDRPDGAELDECSSWLQCFCCLVFCFITHSLQYSQFIVNCSLLCHIFPVKPTGCQHCSQFMSHLKSDPPVYSSLITCCHSCLPSTTRVSDSCLVLDTVFVINVSMCVFICEAYTNIWSIYWMNMGMTFAGPVVIL